MDVGGKVRRPGIQRLPAGSRVADALRAAGGVRRGANTDGLNRARLLVDGEQVLVDSPAPVPGPHGGPRPVPRPRGVRPAGARGSSHPTPSLRPPAARQQHGNPPDTEGSLACGPSRQRQKLSLL
ncbi:SLBB domain-containing protein, partial [Streptomyces europaeiscabiei]|uniref:SLBB domain-containing protein n=1 Tax=Streptomyces europaeiscabiei TaxID=146819 RepID=UPI0038D3D97E